MSYYGDHYAGDPGLFSFVKKLKLGRVIGTVLKSAPGTAGIYAAVRALRAQEPHRAALKQVNVAASPVQAAIRSDLAGRGLIRPRLTGAKRRRLVRAPATAYQKKLRSQYIGRR